MKRLADEARLYIAERLMFLAATIAPSHHEDSRAIYRAYGCLREWGGR